MGNQTVAIDSIVFSPLLSLCFYGCQWIPLTVWSPTFFKYVFFLCSKKKETHTGMEQQQQLEHLSLPPWFQGVSNAIQVHNECGCKCVNIHRARVLMLFNTSPCPWWWNRDSMLLWRSRPSDERTRHRCSGCQGQPGRARENERGQWSGW